MFCMTNVKGRKRPHPAFASVAVASGSIMMSAMSLVTTRDSASVAPTSASTAARQVDTRATRRRESASNAPTLRNAATIARMLSRQASTLRSK